MGLVSMAILGFTALALLLGALFGLCRGCNRSLLRLILVIISVVVAFLFKDKIIDIIMNIQTGEGTVRQAVNSAVLEAGVDFPESVLNLIFAIIEIIMGIVVFYLVFLVLRIVSWLIIFPICKIFVKKGENKRSLLGALFGLVQGAIIAVMVCAPVSGVLVQVNKLTKIKVEGKPVLEMSADIGLDEYLGSEVFVIYDKAGGWLYDSLTTVTEEDGTVVNFGDTCDVLVSVVNVADTVVALTDSVSVMTSTESGPQDKTNAMKSVADRLVELDASVSSLSDYAKELVNDFISVVADLISQGEGGSSEGGESGEGSGDGSNEMIEHLTEILDNFDVNKLNLSSAGESLRGIATYIEKTNESTFGPQEAFTQEEANTIVNGFAENKFILDLLTLGDTVPQIIGVSSEYAGMFSEAIGNSALSTEDKGVMNQMLGLA